MQGESTQCDLHPINSCAKIFVSSDLFFYGLASMDLVVCSCDGLFASHLDLAA